MNSRAGGWPEGESNGIIQFHPCSNSTINNFINHPHSLRHPSNEMLSSIFHTKCHWTFHRTGAQRYNIWPAPHKQSNSVTLHSSKCRVVVPATTATSPSLTKWIKWWRLIILYPFNKQQHNNPCSMLCSAATVSLFACCTAHYFIIIVVVVCNINTVTMVAQDCVGFSPLYCCCSSAPCSPRLPVCIGRMWYDAWVVRYDATHKWDCWETEVQHIGGVGQGSDEVLHHFIKLHISHNVWHNRKMTRDGGGDAGGRLNKLKVLRA